MTITFNCESCSSEFTVDDKLAGRAARCKRCGAKLLVPTPETVGSRPSLKFASDPPVRNSGGEERRILSTDAARRASVATSKATTAAKGIANPAARSVARATQDSEEPLRLAEPKVAGSSVVAASQKSVKWLNAVQSQIALKPVTLNNLRSLHSGDDLQSDSVSYDISASERNATRHKRKSHGPGLIKSSYRGVFRKTGQTLRWFNETAYGISILFMILACVGYIIQSTTDFRGDTEKSRNAAMAAANAGSMDPSLDIPIRHRPQNRLLTIGVSGIVILSVFRLFTGIANLVVIPFRQSPMQGVMFLIPPMTFFYLSSHWNKVRKPVSRIIEPAVTLLVVVLAYAFAPGLAKVRDEPANLRTRVNDAVKTLKSDVRGDVKKAQGELNRLEKTLPANIDKAQKTLQDKVQQAIENLPKSDQNDATKSDDENKPSPEQK